MWKIEILKMNFVETRLSVEMLKPVIELMSFVQIFYFLPYYSSHNDNIHHSTTGRLCISSASLTC